MDGTTLDCIIIPIVVMISLAAWLVAVMLADARPAKTESRQAAVTAEPVEAAPSTVPRQAATPGPEAGRAGHGSGRAGSGRPVHEEHGRVVLRVAGPVVDDGPDQAAD
ncbi:MAG TPA: hypothetical protein VK817_04140 [Trebonia sp.]|jgi:hypothetical protein|nr:hypothetical protein [Trebonia sp.]